jgi:hypothetical protein
MNFSKGEKNMKKKVLALALILTMALTVGLVACAPKTTGTYAADKDVYYFGWAHQATLGVAHLKTNSNGDLVVVELDEIFYLAQWTKVTADAKALIGDDAVIEGEAGVFYAKYIAFNGDIYQAQKVFAPNKAANASNDAIVDSALSEPTVPNLTDRVDSTGTLNANIRYFKLTGTTLSATSLDTDIVNDQELAFKYYLAAKTARYELNTAVGTTAASFQYLKGDKTTKIAVSRWFITETAALVKINNGTLTNAGQSLFKRESGYWTVSNGEGALGILRTYAQIEKYVTANGFGYAVPTVNTDAVWVATGATATDTPNYLTLLKSASELIAKK